MNIREFKDRIEKKLTGRCFMHSQDVIDGINNSDVDPDFKQRAIAFLEEEILWDERVDVYQFGLTWGKLMQTLTPAEKKNWFVLHNMILRLEKYEFEKNTN
jgi:hypothetical protein